MCQHLKLIFPAFVHEILLHPRIGVSQSKTKNSSGYELVTKFDTSFCTLFALKSLSLSLRIDQPLKKIKIIPQVWLIIFKPVDDEDQSGKTFMIFPKN